MTQESGGSKGYDPFFLNSVYPDAAAIFTWRPKPLKDVKDECVVVLDTNVLAVPYTKISTKSLDQIGDTYRQLINSDGLVVPGQVAREFARLRAKKLTELEQQLADAKSKAVRLHTGKYPLLGAVEDYRHLLEVE